MQLHTEPKKFHDTVQVRNTRDFYRSTLFHFQLGMPEIITVNGYSKLNPAFVGFCKKIRTDYYQVSYEAFVDLVRDLFNNATLELAYSTEIHQHYKSNNDYLVQSWEQYIKQVHC